jgi:acetylornithine deacetylase
LLFKLLDEIDLDLTGDVIAHLVVEEENGGNGSLAMIRKGESADGCIVLEPTENKILTSIRGAVWFKIKFFGKAGHSGQANKTKSALLMAKEAIDILTDYHRDLLLKSRDVDLFDKYKNPMPITFGKLKAGNWPASAPNNAVLEGVLGFLPNKTKEQVFHEMKDILLERSETLTEDNFDLSFTYKHDCSVICPGHGLPQGLITANDSYGIKTNIDAMTASCDAWFYNNQLGIPTVVYGPGTLSVAHSRDENIKTSEIMDVAKVLYVFVNNYCRLCK